MRDQAYLVRQTNNGTSAYQDTTTTYDGYGRLKTKHVPEQNAGAVSTYAYNNDDTVYSVTDARGASATYGYNNRHLGIYGDNDVDGGDQTKNKANTQKVFDACFK